MRTLRGNSLRIGTGNLFRPNRELNGGIRELFGRIREEAIGLRFCRGVQGTKARCAIAALGSYPSTPLAETPRPSCRHWRTRDGSSPHASRRVGDVSPIQPGRFLRVPWSAALPAPDRAALSTRSDGVSGRLPTP